MPLTRRADVGLMMLADMGLSYRLTLPNRVGDFVRAGVPQVVSDMPELRRVAEGYGVGVVLEGTGARPLADAVREVLRRSPWPQEAFAAAQADFDWEREREQLRVAVRKIENKQQKTT